MSHSDNINNLSINNTSVIVTINNFVPLVSVNITDGLLENDSVDKFKIIEHAYYLPAFPCNVIKAVTPGAINMRGSENSYQGASDTLTKSGWFWPESESWFGRYVSDDLFNADMPWNNEIRYTHNPEFRGSAGDIFDVYTRDGIKITFKLNVDIGACNYCGFCYNVLNSVYYKYAAIMNS
jgi:hypothetical protein